MAFWNRKDDVNLLATLEAVSRSQAMIEFTADGRILTANENFLRALGYQLPEIVGQHHSMFVDPAEVAAPAYRQFWDNLAKGKFDAAEYRRIAKGGREVWIQASYNPVLDKSGNVLKVVKVAVDITEQKLRAAEAQGQIAAISRSQAVIEFTLTGEIITANDNFCQAMGYRLEEIRGRHHRMFVEPAYGASADYQSFWEHLREGQFQAAEFLRIGKGGREVWIQASYNPILDAEGKPFKVVKFATDITARKTAVNSLGDGLAQLAEGDLTARLDEPFERDLEPVRTAFNGTVERFASIVTQLRDTSGTLKVATGEILSGANDLAERTTRQAAAIEETSAAMEQLSTTVSENAKRAEAAKAKAALVSSTAEVVGTVMQQSNEAMERISHSSTKISNIIGLIDDIAFQTNLLALNASVEAARAGDAGKGFAVVAVEVRRLAQSAAGASSEVKTLIEQSSGEVNGGSRLVAEAAEKLLSVLEGVRESAGLSDAIAQATKEQSYAIAEVTTAIRQMDEMTQHNAALVEETNAAIEQTEGQATELDRIVDIFKVADEAPRPQKLALATSQPRAPHSLRRAAEAKRAAASHYLSDGNAALKHEDWSEF
jgi:methyl-accepting chemotaxis protein